VSDPRSIVVAMSLVSNIRLPEVNLCGKVVRDLMAMGEVPP